MLALYILLGIVAFFCLVLSIKIRIDAEYIESFQMRVSWLFLHFNIFPLPEKKAKAEKPAPEKPPTEEAPVQEKPKKPNMFKTFYENQGVPGVIQLLKDTADALGSMLRSLKKHLIVDELFLWITVSQGSDAAATAIEYGQICKDVFPALGFICSNLKVKKYDAEIEPDFIGTFSSAQFAAAVSIRPIFVVGAGIAMIFRLLFKVILKLLRQKPQTAEAGKDEINTEAQNIQGGA